VRVLEWACPPRSTDAEYPSTVHFVRTLKCWPLLQGELNQLVVQLMGHSKPHFVTPVLVGGWIEATSLWDYFASRTHKLAAEECLFVSSAVSRFHRSLVG